MLMPSARTVIVTATVYNTARPVFHRMRTILARQIARYAWGEDYHDVIGARLDALLAWMREIASAAVRGARLRRYRTCSGTRLRAAYAGIGWIGKNTCVISPELGSWVFLGEIICSLPLDTDAPAFDQCGDCMLCLERLPARRRSWRPACSDSTRCISHATIEHRGDIPAALGPRSARMSMVATSVRKCARGTASPRPRRIRRGGRRPVWDQPALVDLSRMPDAALDARCAAAR